MKRILSLTAILASALVFTSAISINQSPLNVPQDEKGKKHIKMVKIGDDGKKMEIDTVMKVDEVLIWNGDTIDGGHAMKWVSKGDFDMDMDFDMDFDVEEDGSGNVFIMKSGNKTAPAVYEFKTEDGDSSKQYRIKVIGGDEADVLKWHSKGDNDMFFGAPAMAPAHKIIRIDKQDGNVIDLSDPGIISFEKKELKDGREKITIVREKPAKESKEIHEEIIMKSASNSVFIEEGMPHKSKQIKVIAGDDGKVEIFEDGKVWNVHEGDDDVQVIEKDGKKITIKKIKKDGEMKVDVEVEEEVKEQK